MLESGASVKEALALTRHAMPAMTMNVYGRTRNEHLVQIVERVGEMVSVEENVPEVCLSPLTLPLEMKGMLRVFQEVQRGTDNAEGGI